MNKKGNFLDWFLIPVILLMIVITVFAMYMVVSKVNDSGMFSSSVEAQSAIDKGEAMMLNWDNIMLFIIIGLSLYVIISSSVVWYHPAFLIVGLVLLAIAISMAAMLTNAFFTFADHSGIVDYSVAYPKSRFIMEYMPIYILIMGVLATISMYVGKNQ